MNNLKIKFIELIKRRSYENKVAIEILFEKGLYGKCISILREELDSFIRVMYLGRIYDSDERERLMNLTLKGEMWKVLTHNNKWKKVTDRDMVNKSNELHGYIQYVYKFGCAFIHLSDFHNYKINDPFAKLSTLEKRDIRMYLNQYHQFPDDKELNIENISNYIPDVFKKISNNLSHYFSKILNDKMILM